MRAACLAALLAAGPAVAHDGEIHAPEPPRPEPASATGFTEHIGGPFSLVDQTGRTRTEINPDGLPQLVFFGYASCPGICSAVFPTLAALTDRLAASGIRITPVLITVDPVLDTPATLAAAAPKIHPDLVALTGAAEALASVRAAYQVDTELLFVSPEDGPIYSHGSFIYLLDARGNVLTLLPPILSPERMAEVVLGYL